ncbi:GNAT family N-acetyltransferase [Belliella sp. DSM 107340]|uniref:GNAT family N-acetyltransferase n=1 Tax=Belliella calami TaxID=2923436 RepID=A0ABS9UST3_9BACT|nr:GNAT family N-acetyltransferase [Belliella calami]MCH7399465.1 GNAT family N-acetyltransferase [Belliella calami]
MENHKFQIIPYSNNHSAQLIDVWEKSVLATHSFLIPSDFESIKKLVQSMDFSELDVFCLIQGDNLIGFIGVFDFKIEMLFFSPDYIGKNLGRMLLEYAVNELKANKVDVNEQNIHAVGFYQKFGFVAYERTELDDQGNPYPILRMQLK